MILTNSIRKFINNKKTLIILSCIVYLNLIGYVVMKDFSAIIYFILLSILTSFFSQNLVIILGIPFILVNLYMANTMLNSYSTKQLKEGMENKDKDKPEHKKTDLNTTDKLLGLPITPLEHNEDPVTNDTSEVINDENFEVGRSKKNNNGYNIDYASTIEDAYDQLNKILGSDGIKRLTEDTQGLMKQQMQLAESMKQMGPMIAGMKPLLTQAEGLLGNMGDNKSSLGNLVSMAKQFTSSAINTTK